CRSTTSLTGTPSRSFSTSASANSSPTPPGRKPNWLMWTEEDAERMSASIGGEKYRPSTSASTDAARLSGKRTARSRSATGRVRSRSACSWIRSPSTAIPRLVPMLPDVPDRRAAAVLVGVTTAHSLRGLRGVRRDVERETERDQHVVPEAVDPDDGRPGDDVHQRRPGQEQEPEQPPDPARDRGVGLVAEDPPEEEGDPRPDAAGEEENATHAGESGASSAACQPSCAPGRGPRPGARQAAELPLGQEVVRVRQLEGAVRVAALEVGELIAEVADDVVPERLDVRPGRRFVVHGGARLAGGDLIGAGRLQVVRIVGDGRLREEAVLAVRQRRRCGITRVDPDAVGPEVAERRSLLRGRPPG